MTQEHQVYIAVSQSLIAWAFETHQRVPVKIGYTGAGWLSREFGLREGHDGDDNPCCGRDDWRIVATLRFPTKKSALEFEKRFLASFEPFDPYLRHAVPWWIKPVANGEGELFFLPRNPYHPNEGVQPIEPKAYAFYKFALPMIRRCADAARAITPPLAEELWDNGEDDFERDRALWLADQECDLVEAQDCAARNAEEGFFYED